MYPKAASRPATAVRRNRIGGRALTTAATALLATSVIAGLAACGDDSTGGAQTSVDIRVDDRSIAVDGVLRAAGTVRITNAGDQLHALQFRRLAPGHGVAEAVAALDQEGALDRISTELAAPGGIVTPGHTVESTTTELTPGQYLVIDTLPVEGDPNGTMHFQRGLVSHLTVQGSAVNQPTPTESYTVKAGRPIDGPASLTAGHHRFAIALGDADGRSPALFRLDNGQSVERVLAAVTDTLSAQPWPAGTGRTVAQSMVASMSGPLEQPALVLGVDLTPGTYALADLVYGSDGQPTLGPESITLTVRA